MLAKDLDLKSSSLIILFGLIMWFCPHPSELTAQIWHLLVIFLCTIIGVISLPMPIGAIALCSITTLSITDTLTLKQALTGFSSEVVWLVVLVYFIARGFIKSGLGKRIAYFLIAKFGHTTIGLSYSLILTEFIISPFIPSMAARGGVIFPITQALAQIYSDREDTPKKKGKTAAFLVQICFQCNVITSALFLTSMAGNPLAVDLAKSLGVTITWMGWAKAAALPGIINLILLPIFVYFILPPTTQKNDEIRKTARNELINMGKIKTNEIIVSLTFLMLIILWMCGDVLGVDSTTASFVGIVVLLLTNVVTWDDMTKEKSAWETYVWFGTLVMLSKSLSALGLMVFVNNLISNFIAGSTGFLIILMVGLLFFYLHYFFASITVHIMVMYATFLALLLSLGVPPFIAAISLALLANLSGGLTHYANTTAPIYFGAGYLSTPEWWKVGFVVSALNLILWALLAPLWWKILGMW